MADLNDSVLLDIQDHIAFITLNRPHKRNAFSATVFEGLDAAFGGLTKAVRAVVINGAGKHFCAGLDLAEHQLSTPFESVLSSRAGHRLFERIRDCGRPVISALHGAVIGGGLELACCTHVRVADETTFFELPEGRRGIFVGGGASVTVARVIGTSRLTELMLTGRRVDARAAEQMGLAHYVVPAGSALVKATEIANRVSENAQISNYMMLQALRYIGDMPEEPGHFTESLAQALTLTSNDAKEGISAFLEKRPSKF
jgi:enoyl-CoA hydratase/carnithine racemase